MEFASHNNVSYQKRAVFYRFGFILNYMKLSLINKRHMVDVF